jgi:hypothetical protein
VIEVEGKGREALHPHIGEIKADVLRRRATQDFRPVAWFTSEIAVPNCLRNMRLYFTDKTTGALRYEDEAVGNLGDAIALNRVGSAFVCPNVHQSLNGRSTRVITPLKAEN